MDLKKTLPRFGLGFLGVRILESGGRESVSLCHQSSAHSKSSVKLYLFIFGQGLISHSLASWRHQAQLTGEGEGRLVTETLPPHLRGALGPIATRPGLSPGSSGWRLGVETLPIQFIGLQEPTGSWPICTVVHLALPPRATDLLPGCHPGRHIPTSGPVILLFLHLKGSSSPSLPSLLLFLFAQ